MTRKLWRAEREPQWHRMEALLARSQHTLTLLKPDEIREMGLLYRGIINDLSHVQSSTEYRHLEPYLNNLVQRGHARLYARSATSWKDVLRFFYVDFPRCFRRNSALIGLAFLMFMIGTGIALATVHFHPETETYFMPQPVIDQLDLGVLWTDNLQANPSESSFLMTNNIRVAINAFAYGIIFGVGTLLLLLQNGLFAFGGPLAVCFEHGMGGRLLTFVTAHGVIELFTVFIAGGAGMLIGFSLLFPGALSRWTAVQEKSKDALILIMGCFPLLILAGLIEGMVSLNRSVGVEIRITVALASALFLVAYLGRSGRKILPDEPSTD